VPRQLQTILDAVLDGVIVLDGGGRVELLNAEASRILECSAAGAAGLSFDLLLGAAHPISRLARSVAASGRSAIADEVPVERRFSEPLIADAAVAPLFESDGRPSGVVVVLRDRTIQNSLRDAVAQQEKLASYGHIAAGIAHEVKHPLSGIRGAAELLEARAGDERARQTAGLIVREVDRISALVDELMVFAKGEQLDRSLTNLHRVLDGVLELLAVDPLSEKVAVERVYDPSIPELLADERRLTQLFLNLARNALQAMAPAGGRLVVRTRVSVDHRLPGPGGRPLPTVTIEFSDDGPGISPEDLKRLATPFFTTKAQGTGLGLAVARHWASQHGGTLDVQSTLGRGTTARVSLPLRQSREAR
jgi:two-component system nitrogen regulation sensor histidine kinase GlnL